MYCNFKMDCDGIQNFLLAPILSILDKGLDRELSCLLSSHRFLEALSGAFCLLSLLVSLLPRSVSPGRQTKAKRASGELGRKWLRISMVSARLLGRVLFASSLLCWSSGRETARVCGCVVLIGVCRTSAFILVYISFVFFFCGRLNCEISALIKGIPYTVTASNHMFQYKDFFTLYESQPMSFSR